MWAHHMHVTACFHHSELSCRSNTCKDTRKTFGTITASLDTDTQFFLSISSICSICITILNLSYFYHYSESGLFLSLFWIWANFYHHSGSGLLLLPFWIWVTTTTILNLSYFIIILNLSYVYRQSESESFLSSCWIWVIVSPFWITILNLWVVLSPFWVRACLPGTWVHRCRTSVCSPATRACEGDRVGWNLSWFDRHAHRLGSVFALVK
jgi:hypothetical protein